MTSLSDLRARIDDLDQQLVQILADRLEVCREVARLKEGSDTPVIQPPRVREVIDTRRQWAIDAGVDPDFVDQIVRVLLTETHRIEVSRAWPAPAPDKSATTGARDGLDTVTSRIDHVVLAVEDLDAARRAFVEHLGFHDEPMAESGSDVAVVAAGGVRLVLVGRAAAPGVAAYLDRHGSGVHHLAIEVLNAGYARAALEAAGDRPPSAMVVDAHGHEQFFTVHDEATGVQLGFLSHGTPCRDRRRQRARRILVLTATLQFCTEEGSGESPWHHAAGRSRALAQPTLVGPGRFTMARQRSVLISLAALLLLASACGGDDAATTNSTSSNSTSSDTTAPDSSAISEERCAENRAAGTITYLSGFDFAAAASITEVVVADSLGYFEQMCLDVKLTPSFSTANYPLVAANDAQFSSAGNFTEVAEFARANEADLVVLSVDGRTAIDVLIAQPDNVETYDDLKDETIGVKGKLPPSIKALLATHGLIEGEDYNTVLIEGFDPLVHLELPGIVAFPGWKSNEPGQLERAGATFTTFDPTAEGIPGSFGLIYTNAKFLNEHPTAAQDFMRAAMRGLEYSLADPAAAAAICVDAINANGNKNFLSPEGETFRWATEAGLIKELTPPGVAYGTPDVAALEAEIAAYDEAGVFPEGPPPTAGLVDTSVLQGIYDANGKVVWTD